MTKATQIVSGRGHNQLPASSWLDPEVPRPLGDSSDSGRKAQSHRHWRQVKPSWSPGTCPLLSDDALTTGALALQLASSLLEEIRAQCIKLLSGPAEAEPLERKWPGSTRVLHLLLALEARVQTLLQSEVAPNLINKPIQRPTRSSRRCCSHDSRLALLFFRAL